MRLPDVKGRELDLRLLITSIIFLSISLFFVFNGALEWDEGSFLLNAENFSGDNSNFEESRPAAISYMIAAIWQVAGESVPAARALVLLFGLASIAVFYRLADEEFEEPVLPTAVMMLSPLMLYWSTRVYTDVPGLMFVLGSLLAYRRDRLLLSGALISLAGTFRYLFLVFAAGIFVSAALENREKVKEFIGGGFIGAAPFLLYSRIAYGSFLSRIRMYVTRVTAWSDSGLFSASLANLGSFATMLSGLLPLAALGWKDSPLIDKAMLVSYSVFMILFSGNTFNRYWLAALPFVVLMAYRGAGRRLFIVASAAMILISGGVMLDTYQTHQSCSQPLGQALEHASDLEGNFVSDSWAVAGYRLDSPVYSPWTSYEELHRNYSVNYAVVAGEKNYSVVESFPSDCRTYHIYNLSEKTTG